MSTLFAVLLFCTLSARAGGGQNYEEEARKRMGLSYDVEQLQQQLAAPAPAAAENTRGGLRAALPLAPNSDVETVTVFRDRALVTRVRTVALKPGVNAISFEGLPLGIAADSLHAELRGEGAKILAVERASGQGEVKETEATRALRAEAKALADQLGEVRDRMASLLAQRAYLRATLTPETSDQPAPPLAQVKANLDYVGQAEAELAAKLRKEEERAAELDRALTPLLTRLADREATGATVRVDLDCQRAGEVVVALSYQVFGASWTPAYNARLDGAEVEISYFGIVQNHTGETWADTRLRLSTANPSVSGELPELGVWVLGAYGTAMGDLQQGGGLVSELTNATPSQSALPQAGASASFSTARSSGGAVLFEIPGERTVDGDGSEQRLPVGTRSFPVVLEYATTPKLVSEVYRRGRLKYTGDAPLLPGTLSTFVGGDYIGSSPVPAVTPGEELLLSFGTDDRFKVERTLLSRELDHPGAGRRSLRYTFHYRITVTNHGERAEKVTVTDQVPISQTDRVVVKLLETTPALPAREDDPPGVMRWALELAPRQSAVIDLRFSVTGPQDDASTQMEFDALEMAY